jgi:hypothetical protein
MLTYFPKTSEYLQKLNLDSSDALDKVAFNLVNDEMKYEKASQALRRRFSRGAKEVDAVDRGGRRTRIKRERVGGLYEYFIQGADGNWFKPDERIWVVASYALWQETK